MHATALTQPEADLRGTTDHTNYLAEFGKRAEQIRKDTASVLARNPHWALNG
jgi:hypothetical protein